MRTFPWLVLAIVLALASRVEARLFWQTFGSTIPAADGCHSTWNSNQDFFVPRYASTGHYELYSPCKSSRSISPANRSSHPLHSGYCSIYGPCHNRWRNHVYKAYCGCLPIQARGRCRGASPSSCGSDHGSYGGTSWDCESPLYNVEAAHLDILGSIPVEGSGLLTQADLSQLGNAGGGQLPLLQKNTLQQLQSLPSLKNLPQFTQP